MLKILSISIFIFIFVGCGATQPYITQYKITSTNFKKDITTKLCKDKTLKVMQSFSDNTLMSRDMNYMVGKYQQLSFTKAQWSTPINKMITLNLSNTIRELNIFKSVQNYKSRIKSDYILESNIIDFKQYFSKDLKSSYVKVIIDISLIDYNSNKVIASKTFSSIMNSETLDANGGVKSLNKLFSNTLKQIALWIVNICNDKNIMVTNEV